ncbi:hypothetical protein PGAG_00144 [Phaeocystis globosa virus 12T]|uniref:Uncharacterized protein n=1 Tax=Phaeocystis globosa virus PgV-16T TaxID=3071227 RepID=A0AC59EX24_9VIRU|nr:hypothetical protein PGCG_00185 [Phaeocystis globosa virus]AET73033.1 hypothetical protein PGAG_00144 [Phaeocystis globosa virus 12T]AET73856.1 hypothetical protein PGBG_00148 [Phaeocystis globosa virus 14T]AGM15496.1 hypothetical protein PGCG_00185 [Phaeocystis globosa virus PgV-16T]UYE94226.1 hypothetical protein PGV14T_00185 [Phaeocystis globosa virus]
MDNIDYDNGFICTYNLIEDDQESIICYQAQLLQALKQPVYDDDKISIITGKIYDLLKDNEEIQEILNILSEKLVLFQFFKSNNKELDNTFVFPMLFSFEYFHLFHKLLSNYISNKSLQENHFSQIKQLICDN